MIPRTDLRFLCALKDSLQGSSRRYIVGDRRAATALILRFQDTTAASLAYALKSMQNPCITSRHVCDFLTDNEKFINYAAVNSELEVLFMKRTESAGDNWSGQVCPPGGKRDADDSDDLACAMRETREEIGIDLHGPEYVFFGQLGDANVYRARGLVVSCFVFLHVGIWNPLVKLSERERSLGCGGSPWRR